MKWPKRHIQDDFTSLTAHQLRTLPNIIGWDIESLLMQQGFTPRQRHVLENIAETNARMVDLIDTMLNISRIEVGTVSVTPEMVDIRTIIKEELGQFQPLIKQQKLRIITSYPQGCWLQTDSSFLRVIIQNLLSNAFKYTPEGGRVSIKVASTKKGFTIEIADSGFGIPQHQHSKVFTRLFRADNVSGTVTGNGLGLYLVKLLVSHLHGKISFTSKEDEGTCFTIFLPLKGPRRKLGATKLTVAEKIITPPPNKPAPLKKNSAK